MVQKKNEFGQPIGESVPAWTPRRLPDVDELAGRYCRLERLSVARHGTGLSNCFVDQSTPDQWTYLGYGPFESHQAFVGWLAGQERIQDPRFFAVWVTGDPAPSGLISLLRIDQHMGSIEIGHVHFGRELRRTRAATEAVFLLIKHVFDNLGYRRCEWKCDSLNQASRRAAERLGFQFEGVFREDRVYKGRNRDTAWYSLIDKQWPEVKQQIQLWLLPENFDEQGMQFKSLRIPCD